MERMMPLYTYITSYRGSTAAAQGSFSNYKGFAAQALGAIPQEELPGITPKLRQEFLGKIMCCDWFAVPNRSDLWRASFELDGSDFVVYVVQTKP